MELDSRNFDRLVMWLCNGAHNLGEAHLKAVKEVIKEAVRAATIGHGERGEDEVYDDDEAQSILAAFGETWDKWDREARAD